MAAEWSFLTNHAQALLVISRQPDARLKDLAAELGVTERTAFALVRDLTIAGYVLKERDGRRVRYVIQEHLRLPDSTVRERTLGEVLSVLAESPSDRSTSRRARRPAPAHKSGRLVVAG